MYNIKTEAKGLVSHGVNACAGCGLEIAFRTILGVLGEDTIVVTPPGCIALFSGLDNVTNMKIPGYQCNLENSAASAAGIRAGLDALGNDHTTVLVFAGDGATADIGIQSLSAMFERGERVLYICYDNEAYMNTGIQGSSSTPQGASTTTTPKGKTSARKDIVRIAMAHRIPYAATASIANIPDLIRKVKKAREVNGPSFVHIQVPCPTGWVYSPALTIEVGKKAIQTGAWVLYEYENGKIKLNTKIHDLTPIDEYLSLQGRFNAMTAEEKTKLGAFISASYDELSSLSS